MKQRQKFFQVDEIDGVWFSVVENNVIDVGGEVKYSVWSELVDQNFAQGEGNTVEAATIMALRATTERLMTLAVACMNEVHKRMEVTAEKVDE